MGYLNFFFFFFFFCREYGDIYPLLDVEDMVMMKTPDWKCVFTYVQSYYRRFRDGREKPRNTRTLILNTSSPITNSSAEVRDTPTRNLVLELDANTPPSSPKIPSVPSSFPVTISSNSRLIRQFTLPANFIIPMETTPPNTPWLNKLLVLST